MTSTSIIPLLAFVFSLLFLGWGFWRSRRFGKLGKLSWLQLVSLLSPWLVYFGLFLAGVFISFSMLLLLLLVSTVSYVAIGNQIRKVAEEQKPPMPNPQTVASEVNKQEVTPLPLQTQPKYPSANSVPLEDLKAIQGIFGIETFYATETIPYQEGIIFKGNLRGEPDEVHPRLLKALRDRLGDKYNLFLIEGQEGKPVMVVLPSNLNQPYTTVQQKVLAVILLVVNIFTAMAFGGQLQYIDLLQEPEKFLSTLPFALGIFLILGCREAAQRWMASKYDVRLSLPFLLPSTQLGSFGAFSRMQSPLPSRQALFDIGIAPAIASGTVSLAILLLGLVLSANGMGNLEIPSQIFQYSVLVGALAKLILGNALHINIVAIHPLVVLGWIGAVITALNLMPAGQLDGGRVVQSLYGRRTASWTTALTLVCLAIATLINPLALYWGGIILILLRDLERPMLNEISEVDSDRDALGVFALFWMLITILPMTSSVAERLGIGN